ncbi:MAG TPA: fumarylacetoacetate hydrolase family protein [Longimicrobium sp.]|jgi:2-keto-4-pentenoate hydratase/2-oxohepta-3-ene-1,7-dioic acid hydratase in catechol pathway
MKLVTYEAEGRARIGALVEGGVVDLGTVAADMLSLIERGEAGLDDARAAVEAASDVLPMERVRLLAPIPRPRKNIVCLGMNYAEHAYESARAKGLPEKLPEHPVFFTKSPTTVIGHGAEIPLDPAITTQLDWEVELGFVLGRTGKNIAREDALGYIFGYTVINDISARDLQNRHQQFFKGKSLDGTCPMGPCIVTADELPDAGDLALSLRVNGKTMQDSRTRDLVFDIPTIIAVLSRGQTVEAGDVVSTGTPSGVGMGLDPQTWLKPGDVLEAEIERIGVLRNTVAAA